MASTGAAPAQATPVPATTNPAEPPIQRHSVHTLVFRSMKRSHDMFISDQANLPLIDEKTRELRKKVKGNAEYGAVIAQAEAVKRQKERERLTLPEPPQAAAIDPTTGTLCLPPSRPTLMITGGEPGAAPIPYDPTVPPPNAPTPSPHSQEVALLRKKEDNEGVKALLPKKAPTVQKPNWHPPWKLYRVISGHTGWVRCIDVEPGNQWFASGSADRIIKIWDMASGKLKISLTGHISAVRGLKISHRHPYLYSAGEDKQIKCWDLEMNKVIRHYHGHLSAVYDLDVHPTIDVLITCGRDSTARVWDMRTKAQVHCLCGHTNTVASVRAQATEPQIITGSHDSTIRLWDLAAGKSRVTLTHHKKSVRAVAIHPALNMFASASPDNLKQWKCPDGEFVQNMTGHNAIVNCLKVNEDGVLVSGGDNGSMYFWDWKSGFSFQKIQVKPQSGSIDSEAGLYDLCFDHSQSRLITAEADKTIKLYREDETATEETHPVYWRPEILTKKKFG